MNDLGRINGTGVQLTNIVPIVTILNLSGTQRENSLRLERIIIGNPLDFILGVATLASNSGETILRNDLLDPSCGRIVPDACPSKLWSSPPRDRRWDG
jgi:hypothetical protein